MIRRNAAQQGIAAIVGSVKKLTLTNDICPRVFVGFDV